MKKILVGKVMHFFSKPNVAALSLNSELKVGDKVRIEHKDGSLVLEQVIDSMQIEYKNVNSAKAGDDVAIKLNTRAHEGNFVYKVE